MLDKKKCVKNGQNSNASYENEIHRVDSPFNEDSRNITFLASESLFRGRDGEWSIPVGNTGLYSLVSKSCITFIFAHVGSNYLLKTEEISLQAKFCPKFAALPSLKLVSNFDN